LEFHGNQTPDLSYLSGRVYGSFSETLLAANAYRGELLGLMAIHLILLSVNKLHPELTGSVEIVSDCLGALKRVSYLPPYRIPTRCHHFDILKTILVSCRGLTFTTYYSHVKAHQDNKDLFAKLSRKAQLNCTMPQKQGYWQMGWRQWHPVKCFQMTAVMTVAATATLTVTAAIKHMVF
jgi:hypothetical protein